MYIRTLWSRVRNVSTKLLDVIALPTEGIEPGFNRMPMIPGVHLRWSFYTPTLVFRRTVFKFTVGFTGTRAATSPLPFPVPGEWELIHTVLPPASLVATTGLSDSVIAAPRARAFKKRQARHQQYRCTAHKAATSSTRLTG